MMRDRQIFGRIQMTTAILALVMLAIVGSIAVVSGAIYLNMRNEALAASRQSQEANLGVAATVLERRISGSALTWADDGKVGSFQTWKIPAFDGTEIVDSVTRLTHQDAIVYAFDAATKTSRARQLVQLEATAIELPMPLSTRRVPPTRSSWIISPL